VLWHNRIIDSSSDQPEGDCGWGIGKKEGGRANHATLGG